MLKDWPKDVPYISKEDLEKIPLEYKEFAPVFSKALADRLPPHRPGFDCYIKVIPGRVLPVAKLRPTTIEEDRCTKEFLDENLAKGFIVPSKSKTCSALFFIDKEKKKHPSISNDLPDLDMDFDHAPEQGLESEDTDDFIEDSARGGESQEGELSKKKKKKRPVVNYAPLDKHTEKFQFPTPIAHELLAKVGKGKIFTKFDCYCAFNQLRMMSGYEELTAWITPQGLFHSLVMPFGLADAPRFWNHFVNAVFSDMIGVTVVVYFDDILVFSENKADHPAHVKAVLQRMMDYGLYASINKCQFGLKELKYLGYKVSAQGIKLDESYSKAIEDWPEPKDKKQLASFIGIAKFAHHFIKDFAKIAKPLNILRKEDAKFFWRKDQAQAFQEIKAMFKKAPVLLHPDRGKPFFVESDASDYAIGMVLLQKGSDGKLHPVAFASRSLTSAEIKYPVYDKELLAIVEAFHKWRHFLEDAMYRITVFTDHAALKYLANAKIVNSRQARWSLQLSRFDYTITHVPGSSNVRADALSRRPDLVPEGNTDSVPQPIIAPEVIRLDAIQGSPSRFLDRLRSISESERSEVLKERSTQPKNGLIYRNAQIYVPKDLRATILQSCHDSLLGGHFGRSKTLALVSREFWCPKMMKDVFEYVDSCHVCSRSKKSTAKKAGLLHPLETPTRAWRQVTMDFITELPPSKGFTTLMVIVDRFTKMVQLIPFFKLPTAEETAQAYIDHVFVHHGLPDKIVSDRGPQFASKFWQRFWNVLGVESALSTAFHPQTDGQTERLNQVIERYLRSYVSYSQDDWANLLPMAQFAINNTPTEATGESPFFAYIHDHPKFLPLSLPQSQLVPAAEEKAKFVLQSQEAIIKNLEESRTRMKESADRKRREAPSFSEGDEVWLDARNIKTTRPSKKLDYTKLGTYKVKRALENDVYELSMPQDLGIHPRFHVYLLSPVTKNSWNARSQVEKPKPLIVNGQKEYLVESILYSRRKGRGVVYLVHWAGQSETSASWEPASHLSNASELVLAFHESHPDRPRAAIFGRAVTESLGPGGG